MGFKRGDKMSFGEAFREIRRARDITIDNLADEFVSKSTISRFERDEADITFEKLLHLMDKLKISMREFTFLARDVSIHTSSLELFPKAIMDRDLELLERLVNEEWSQFEDTGSKYAKLSAIVIEAHHKSLNEQELLIEKENIQFLTDYLFQCEMWTQFDLVLLGDSMSFLPIETAIILAKELVKKTEAFHKDRQIFETMINIFINIILVCLEKGRLKETEEFLGALKNLNVDETFFLERVLIKYVEGLFFMKQGTLEQGERQVRESLLAMELAGTPELEAIFRTMFDKMK